MDKNERKRSAGNAASSHNHPSIFASGMPEGVEYPSAAVGEQSCHSSDDSDSSSQDEIKGRVDNESERKKKRHRVDNQGVVTESEQSESNHNGDTGHGQVQAIAGHPNQLNVQLQANQAFPTHQAVAALGFSSQADVAILQNLPQHAIVGQLPVYPQAIAPLNPVNYFPLLQMPPFQGQDFQQQTVNLLANPMVVAAAAQALMYSQAYGLVSNPATYGYHIIGHGAQQGQIPLRANPSLSTQYMHGFPGQHQVIMAPTTAANMSGGYSAGQARSMGAGVMNSIELQSVGQVGSGTIQSNPLAQANLYQQTTTSMQEVRRKRGPLLYTSIDDDVLAENQILVRKQIEFFEAELEDVETITSGRRRPIALGQVGIQCRHCAHLPLRQRKKAAVYYPSKVNSIYQAAQNMNVSHLSDSCQHIDEITKNALISFLDNRSSQSHGGKQYWASSAKTQGIYETEADGLRYSRPEGQQQNPGS